MERGHPLDACVMRLEPDADGAEAVTGGPPLSLAFKRDGVIDHVTPGCVLQRAAVSKPFHQPVGRRP